MTASTEPKLAVPPDGLRLSQFEVTDLFGEFNYKIPFNPVYHVTAIIGPNGMGKTLCLRMINSLFTRKWAIFSEVHYGTARYKFSSGALVEVSRQITGEVAVQDASDTSQEQSINPGFEVRVFANPAADPIIWQPRNLDSKRNFSIERYVPYLSRVSPNKWRHDYTGELYGLSEVVDTFGDSLPPAIKDRAYGKTPEVLTALIDQIDCRLIETQRLLILPYGDADTHYPGTRRPRSTLAITQKAESIKEIISREINTYATLSQSLDRSFPRRVVQQPTQLPPDDLKAQLQDLDQKRRELMDAGILDTEADEPVALPPGTLPPAIAQVLSVYVEDTRKKLSSLSNILSKIKLFKELIDERFVTKDVQIGRVNGIEVIFHGAKVPLDRLSSGEQHQLVLFFEMLFEIKRNSLILIDEPELSLHVAWQKKFISDLMRIIELNRFDVVLATHSPQLIGRWNDIVIELGDVYEGEDADFERGQP